MTFLEKGHERYVEAQETLLCELWDTLVSTFRSQFPQSTMRLHLDHWGARDQFEEEE